MNIGDRILLELWRNVDGKRIVHEKGRSGKDLYLAVLISFQTPSHLKAVLLEAARTA